MPIFETDEERTYFLTTFLIHPDFTGSNDLVNDPVNEPENDVKLTDSEHKVLHAIEKNVSASYAKLAAELSISESTVKRAIQSLKKKGLILRDGSDKTGKWIIL